MAAQTEGEAVLILHEFSGSGNCYKIRLTAAHLKVKLERREYDLMKGETRTPKFLAHVNPDGRIPVLQDGDWLLPESNAACYYLAEGSALVPDDRIDRAHLLQWMFWEQSAHEPNIATLRFWLRFVGLDALSEAQRMQIPGKRIAGLTALGLMDRHLDRHDWFVGGRFTIADIALFAYTHLSDEAGFDLAGYPAVVGWMERIMRMPAHIGPDD